MEHGVYNQWHYPMIKLAQYLASLTTQQDVWSEVGQALVSFLDTDLVAIGERRPEEGIVMHHWSFSERVSPGIWSELEAKDAIADVLDSGFLVARCLSDPEPLAVVFLPVTQDSRIAAVMLVGQRMSGALPNALLDVYLAVAGLVGTTVARLTSEKELRKHRQHLEVLVEERTSALSAINTRLQQEITHRERAEEALRGERDTLIRVLEAIEDSICIVDANDGIQYVNPAFKRDFPAAEGAKRDDSIVNNREAMYPSGHLQEVLSGGNAWTEWRCAKDGKTYEMSETPLRNTDGTTSVLTIFRDITERKRSEDAIKQMAYHDSLTNLPNRSLFNDRLKQAVAHAHRHQQKLALMMLDLDHFKVVNDTLGHRVGDSLLRAAGERMISLVREQDTVARTGGDEFVLIFPELAKKDDAAKVAEKIVNAFRQPFLLDGRQILITTSIGIALYPDHGEDDITLMTHADLAMYRAKHMGRNDYQLYQPDHRSGSAIDQAAPSANIARESRAVRADALDKGKDEGRPSQFQTDHPDDAGRFRSQTISSSTGIALAINQPWTRSQPKPRTRSRSAWVSTPSATVERLSLRAMLTLAARMARTAGRSAAPCTKPRSSFSSLKGMR